jgi:hypothetical protein
MNAQQSNIDPEEYYSATAIIKSGWFPWIKHILTFRGMLQTKEGQEMYKPVIRTAGKYTYYKIKGDTILDVIKSAEDGTLSI